MRPGLKTLTLALVVALLAVPAAFAKGGHGGGKPSWAGGAGGVGHGKPAWVGERGGSGAHGDQAKREKTHEAKPDKAKKHGAEADGEDLEELNPAWYCKTLRTMMEEDGRDFDAALGTNENDANGFGMCVSERAQGGDPAEGVELSGDETACDDDAAAEEETSAEGTSDEEGTADDELADRDETEDKCAADDDTSGDGASDGGEESADGALAAFSRDLVRFLRF